MRLVELVFQARTFGVSRHLLGSAGGTRIVALAGLLNLFFAANLGSFGSRLPLSSYFSGDNKRLKTTYQRTKESSQVS